MGGIHLLHAEEDLVERVVHLYKKILELESLRPSEKVNALFTELVMTCIPPSSIDVSDLPPHLLLMRSHLLQLSATAESLLEFHFSTIITSHSHPLCHLHLFPYFPNYIKLSLLEYTMLSLNLQPGHTPAKIAFVGSGPLPLTSVLLAIRHFPYSIFHNYDIDPEANNAARRLVAGDEDLSARMVFHDANIMEVSAEEIVEYDVVFLAALVGMEVAEKSMVLEYLGRRMAAGAVLVARSAHGARGFLYPMIDDLGNWFEVAAVHHPADEVINSVVIARKKTEEGECGLVQPAVAMEEAGEMVVSD